MTLAKAYAALSPKAPLEPFTFERRAPNPDDVVIDILYSGVCHSDIHQVRDEWFPGIYPQVPGHEIVGRVRQVGTNVTRFKEGDAVGVGCFVDSCIHCQTRDVDREQYMPEQAVMTYNSRDRDGLPHFSLQIITLRTPLGSTPRAPAARVPA